MAKRTKNLTDHQRAIMDMFVIYSLDHLRPPTIRHMCDHFGVQNAAIHSSMTLIAKKGYIVKASLRNWELTDKTKNEYGLLTRRQVFEMRKENANLKKHVKGLTKKYTQAVADLKVAAAEKELR